MIDPANAFTAPVETPSTDFPPLPNQDPQTDWTIYDIDTGKVRLAGHCPRSMILLQHRAENEGLVLERLDNRVSYVDVTADPPRGRNRPTLAGFDRLAIKADNKDAATLNLPIGGIVVVDGVEHECPPGPLVFVADSPGTYTFSASLFPYLDFAAEVVAS